MRLLDQARVSVPPFRLARTLPRGPSRDPAQEESPSATDAIRTWCHELKGNRPDPVRYTDDTVVEIHNKARFVSIRHRADVA